MNAKKPMRKAAVIGRRGVSKDDRKPFRKAITAAPHEMAEGKFISDSSETPSEPKGKLADVSATAKKMPPASPIAKTPRVSVKRLPWADASAKVTAPFLVRLPEATHLKLLWLKDNLPNTSLQKLILSAIEKDVVVLIKKHFRP
jgi:hypothetical protein